MKGTKLLSLCAVGMSFHCFTGHKLHIRKFAYMRRYTPISPVSACVSYACYFPHTKWPTVVSHTEAVDADLDPFQKKSFD